MCANSAAIESIECYMEDIIECLEAFVKKTLFVITIAAGALVAMAMYLLKDMQGQNRYVTGAQTQIEQILGTETNLQERSSSTSLISDNKVIRKESYSKMTRKKSEKPLKTDSKEMLIELANSCCPKKSRSCCSEKTQLSKCPSSLTRVCKKASPSPSACTRQSSCESLRYNISCRESAPSISSKICPAKTSNCPAKTSNLSSAICSLLPLCPVNAPCKRTCKPSMCKQVCSPLPACARTCAPIPTCKSTCQPNPCSRSCGKLGKTTIPSLATCCPPKYKIVQACPNAKKPCNIPKRVSSRTCTKVVKKTSCCSLCCDDDK